MRKSTKLICATLAGLALIFGSISLLEKPSSPAALRIDAQDLDFGSVWIKEEHRHTFSLRNVTNERISVVLHASCGCTALSPEAFTLEPHGEQVVTASLDLIGDVVLNRPFLVGLTADVNGGLRPRQVWTLRGLVRSPVALPRFPIRLEQPVNAARDNDPYVVRLVPHSPFEEVRLRGTTPGLIARLERETPGKAAYLLSITAASEIDLGEHKESITLVALTDDGGHSPSIDVPVYFNVVSPYRIVPEFPHFGALPIGQPYVEPVMVETRLGDPFEITAAVASAPEVELTRSDAEASVYTVTVTPTAVEEQSAELIFVIAPEGDRSNITVVLSFAGCLGFCNGRLWRGPGGGDARESRPAFVLPC